MNRILQVVLSGVNRLSPVLDKAARDVDEYTAKAEQANRKVSESAKESAREQKKSSEESVKASEKSSQATEEAARKITAVKQQLNQLSRDKVSIGMDTVEARLELARVQASLDEIATSTPTARVKAETAAAQAQVAAIQSAINRIDGQTATAHIRIDDSGQVARASTEVNRLIATAIAVSPALGTIGAAAVAGIGVIAPLAATAVAGVGVLALGLSGVVDTVGLLEQRDQAAAVTAGRGASTRVSSSRAIENAKRSEARAVEQAAADVQDAIQAQEDAERDLTREQRDQRQAQLDLVAAREEARQQLEDLTASATDNALAQRQSVLDVARARRELDEILADPGATEEQREQARIDYEEQISRQSQLATQGRRLAAQQAESNRTGIEGSKAVTDAQQRLTSANESVEDATRRVGDTTAAIDKARRDGAERIADAHRAVQDAMTSAGAAGVTAYSAVDAQLEKVNPATRRFAEYVRGTLNPALDGLKATAAAGLLPGVEQAFDELMPYLPRIDDFVGRIAHRFGELSVEGARSLGNPVWQNFFKMLDRDAEPILDDVFHTVLDIASGFAGIATAFAPMARDISRGVRDLSGDFARWGEGLGDSSGFHEFTQYVAENWPHIRETIANVAEVVGNLIEAGAPIGAAYLGGFKLLSDVLAGLPVGVVQALLVAFIGFKTASSIVGVVNGIADGFARLGKAKDNLGQMTQKVGDFNTRVGGIRGAASGAMEVLGGPWGLALGAASVVVGELASAMADASETTAGWTQALIEGGQAAANIPGQIRQLKEEDYGGADNWLERAAYNVDVAFGVAPDLDEATQAADDYYKSLGPVQEATARAAHWQQELSYRLKEYGEGSPEVEAAQRRYAYWTGIAGDRQKDLDGAIQGTVESIDEITGRYKTSTDAEADYNETLANTIGALEGLSGAVLDSSGHLDLSTEAGRKAREQLVGLAESSNDWIDSLIDQGYTTEEAMAKDAQLRQSFYDTALQMTGSKTAAEELTNQIFGIPESREVYITANTEDAQEVIDRFRQGLQSQGFFGILHFFQGKADGGEIGGYSPHDRADNVLIAATAGEFMQPRRAVRQYGTGFMESVRAGTFPASLARGYADGGYVNYPSDADFVVPLELTANARRELQGSAGSGELGATWVSIWDAVHRAIPEARKNSTYRPGDPGYHGRNKAIDFGFGGGPGGAGSVGLASIAQLLYRGFGRTLAELIYDGVGDNTPDVKDGADHTYDSATRLQHTNHVHAAVRDNGGLLPAGLSMVYNGTGAGEHNAILTDRQWETLQALANQAAALPGGGAAIDYDRLAAALAGAAGQTVEANVQVFLGERELTDMVRVVVDNRVRDVARNARAAGAR